MITEQTVSYEQAKRTGLISPSNEVVYNIYHVRSGDMFSKVIYPWLGSVDATLANKCCFFGKTAYCTPIGILTRIECGNMVAVIQYPDESLRADLIAQISDRHKEFYGFRPRRNWDGFSTADLEDFLDELQRLIRLDLELEKIEEQQHAAAVANVTRHETGWTIGQLANL